MRIKKILICFCAIIFSCFSCITNTKDKGHIECEFLIGEWVYKLNTNVKLKFSEDSLHYYCELPNNKLITFSESYSCIKRGDSLLITSKDKFFKFLMLTNNNEVVICNYKRKKGIMDHIDEISVIVRKDHVFTNEENEKYKTKDIFIIPNGFTGICAIAFNQDDCEMANCNQFGDRIFKFDNPSSYILKTKDVEDIINIATNNMKFYYSDSLNQLTELAIIDKSHMKTDKHVKNKTYVINMGFNQIARGKINAILKKPIDGNIVFFKVGKELSLITNTDTLKFN